MQCELLGAVPERFVDQLLQVLIGLSGHPGKHTHVREVVLKAHTSPFTELRLIQHWHTAGKAGSNSRCFHPITSWLR